MILVIVFNSHCTKPITEGPDVASTWLKMADANVDITIEYPVNYSMLNGKATLQNGSLLKSVSWKQVSGPQAYILNPQSLQTRVWDFDYEGTYEFELTVMDNANHFDKDTMVLKTKAGTTSNSQIFLWDMNWTRNNSGFDDFKLEIENFFYFVPVNTVFEIYILRDSSQTWKQVIPAAQNTSNTGYVYYPGTSINSSLVIYELPDIATVDKPDIKIVF